MSESNVVETSVKAVETSVKAVETPKAARKVRVRSAPKAATKTETAPKAATKAAPKDKGHPYLPLFVAIAKGGFAPPKGTDTVKRWLVSGIGYHANKQTAFPRARNEKKLDALLSPQDAAAYFVKMSGKDIEAGKDVNQLIFDQLMIASGGPYKAKALIAQNG